MRRLAFFMLLVVLAPSALRAEPAATWETGDLVFTALPSTAGSVIASTTASPVSHVGIAVRRDDGRITVIHAAGRVREDPLPRFATYGDGRYAVSRFAFRDGEERDRFVAAARRFIGVAYDMQYRLDNETIYCSELVYRAFLDGTGRVPSAPRPMDFAAAGPEAWAFWEQFFHGDVPQGLPGVTPAQYLEAPFAVVQDDFQRLTPSTASAPSPPPAP